MVRTQGDAPAPPTINPLLSYKFPKHVLYIAGSIGIGQAANHFQA
jgi:hypothetical protein